MSQQTLICAFHIIKQLTCCHVGGIKMLCSPVSPVCVHLVYKEEQWLSEATVFLSQEAIPPLLLLLDLLLALPQVQHVLTILLKHTQWSMHTHTHIRNDIIVKKYCWTAWMLMYPSGMKKVEVLARKNLWFMWYLLFATAATAVWSVIRQALDMSFIYVF